jgi:hypothetical protein
VHVPLIERFFSELDAAWRWPAHEKLRLRIIGSAALMLQSSYVRGTKDRARLLGQLRLGLPQVKRAAKAWCAAGALGSSRAR